jgi:hypothetical protein
MTTNHSTQAWSSLNNPYSRCIADYCSLFECIGFKQIPQSVVAASGWSKYHHTSNHNYQLLWIDLIKRSAYEGIAFMKKNLSGTKLYQYNFQPEIPQNIVPWAINNDCWERSHKCRYPDRLRTQLESAPVDPIARLVGVAYRR